MSKRKERRDRARRKVNTYYNEFNKACAAYLARMQDKGVTLQNVMQSNEMIATMMHLEKLKPQETALIEQGLTNFCKALVAANKESSGNG